MTTALLVDDSEDYLEVLKLILRGKGFVTTAVTSGKEALEVIASKPRFDIALVDFMLPELSGVDIYHEFQKVPLKAPTVFAILSVKTPDAEDLEFINKAGIDWIVKPSSAEGVRRMLERVRKRLEKDKGPELL